ncbi:uncharacterized protein PSFLO_07138 [Pseudozyma flocculosa]|uniref:Uncharacterized protein n=1 Tax=Pseudozyma flocculosa TaxID=84751 RepID=A0A5C3FBZ5_9BASI|nr:uncharacterized protein PSFLO_07138 [Pseudozyma flocculosa]
MVHCCKQCFGLFPCKSLSCNGRCLGCTANYLARNLVNVTEARWRALMLDYDRRRTGDAITFDTALVPHGPFPARARLDRIPVETFTNALIDSTMATLAAFYGVRDFFPNKGLGKGWSGLSGQLNAAKAFSPTVNLVELSVIRQGILVPQRHSVATCEMVPLHHNIFKGSSLQAVPHHATANVGAASSSCMPVEPECLHILLIHQQAGEADQNKIMLA